MSKRKGQRGDSTASPVGDQPGWISLPEMLYQNAYIWIVFLSTLDLILTRLILTFGGVEVNPVANEVIRMWGMGGATAFKFALIVLAIIICESVGRRDQRKGLQLSRVLVVLAAAPVIWSSALLLVHRPQLMYPPEQDPSAEVSKLVQTDARVAGAVESK